MYIYVLTTPGVLMLYSARPSYNNMIYKFVFWHYGPIGHGALSNREWGGVMRVYSRSCFAGVTRDLGPLRAVLKHDSLHVATHDLLVGPRYAQQHCLDLL